MEIHLAFFSHNNGAHHCNVFTKFGSLNLDDVNLNAHICDYNAGKQTALPLKRSNWKEHPCLESAWLPNRNMADGTVNYEATIM
jgi:hypothetical protein